MFFVWLKGSKENNQDEIQIIYLLCCALSYLFAVLHITFFKLRLLVLFIWQVGLHSHLQEIIFEILIGNRVELINHVNILFDPQSCKFVFSLAICMLAYFPVYITAHNILAGRKKPSP